VGSMEIQIPREVSPEGAVMRQLRVAADLPQADVARLMDVNAGAYANYELGHRRPRADHIRAFCRALKLPRSMEVRLLILREQDWKRAKPEKIPRVTLGVSTKESKPNVA
jgi:transcriptional regulator with XRE-family HTH domain